MAASLDPRPPPSPATGEGIASWRLAADAAVVGAAERVLLWPVVHWLGLLNALTALTLAGAFAPPFLRLLGLDAAAEAVHSAYLLLCPQRPDHSYFLFGHKLALEHRELAMFGAQLAGGLFYAVGRARFRALPLWAVAVLALPMVWDGFSQVFGWRDSDWLMRTLTGGLFNLALVFWFYPFVDRLLPPGLLAAPAAPAGRSTAGP